jgi:hypothetical protein
MKLKITGRALPKHQQKGPVDLNDPMSFWRSWQSKQPGFIDFSQTSSLLTGQPKKSEWSGWSNMYTPTGLKDLSGNPIQSTLPAAQPETAFKKPDWMLDQNQIDKLKLNSAWAYQKTPEKPKMSGYQKASMIVGGMGMANNILSQSEYRKQQQAAKKFSYTDSAYGSYTPSFSRGYQETNRKNPATNYSYPQFAGQMMAPAYGFAQEGGVLMPSEPMGAYEMDVFNQMPQPNVAPPVAAPVSSEPKSGNVSAGHFSGVNPLAKNTWNEVNSQFQGLKFLGIWGDEKHQKSVSDHNTGDALDIGITGLEQGTTIAQKLIGEAKDKNIKYIIWNKQIWNPSISNQWRPYNGSNPHTDHVHVSFNRDFEAPAQIDPNAGQVSFTHNNPLNVHYGDFAKGYGGAKGAPDGNGNVAIFKDLRTGLKANTDLLFGPNYNNLTISQARNKWVHGNPNQFSSSTPDIVKSMGKDVPLAQLTPQEKDKLFKQFAKWEGKQAYNLIKDTPIFQEGGEYELDDNQIQEILKNGGQIQYL